jgi:hypothetical protein
MKNPWKWHRGHGRSVPGVTARARRPGMSHPLCKVISLPSIDCYDGAGEVWVWTWAR